jgi:hypothetical protein
MMEMQAIFPTAKCVCVNKRGYGMGQANDVPYLVKVAQVHKIPLVCDEATGKVTLPSVALIDGVQDSKPLPFAPGTVDVIVSAHALNQGKLRTHQARLILPRLVPLLDVGGQLSAMVLYNIADKALKYRPDAAGLATARNKTHGAFHVIKMLRLVDLPPPWQGAVGPSFTVLLYERRNSIGLYVTRCTTGQRAHPDPFWGCIGGTTNKGTPPVDHLQQVMVRQ